MADWIKKVGEYAKQALEAVGEHGGTIEAVWDALTGKDRPDWKAGGQAVIDLGLAVGVDAVMDELLEDYSPEGLSWWAHGSPAGLTGEDGKPIMAPQVLQDWCRASEENRLALVEFATYCGLHAADVGEKTLTEWIAPNVERWMGSKQATDE